MANETKIERILDAIRISDDVESAHTRVGKLLIVAVRIDDGSEAVAITLHAWTETDIIRWHDAVVKKRYELERANGKEPTWGEAFAATEWPESRGTK